jgi:hypothetical protein
MNSPVENPVVSEQATFDAITRLEALLSHLYGMCEFGPPAARGECMECDRPSRALWIVGDFLLCHRCTLRRRRVGERLERGAL